MEGGLDDPAVQGLLAHHARELRSTSPPESAHVFDLSGLRAPRVRFWTAYDADGPVGVAALKRLDAAEAELRSMRTAPGRTGEGIGHLLLDHVVAQARRAGFSRVSLVTGAQAFFAPAVALYTRAGFVPCEPFGSYRPDPASVFLTLEL